MSKRFRFKTGHKNDMFFVLDGSFIISIHYNAKEASDLVKLKNMSRREQLENLEVLDDSSK